jgi:hypothetical protein
VLHPHAAQVPPPASSTVKGAISTAIPYLMSVLCHAAAVFFLFKAVTAFTGDDLSAAEAAIEIFVLTVLLTAVTFGARLPRLLKPGPRTFLGAAAAIAIGGVCYAVLMPDPAAERLAKSFLLFGLDSRAVEASGLPILSALVVLVSWIMPRKPRWGRRMLVCAGALVVLLIVAGRIAGATGDEAVWPVLLAGAGFVYVWWLGILLFDLSFMWHRYIRGSVAIENLWFWSQKVDAPATPGERTKLKAALRTRRPDAAADPL